MTIEEMHLAFKMNLDKSGSFDTPAFLPEEIDFWLNAAIVRFVKTRFTGSDKGIGFEGNKKRTEDLQTLIEKYSFTPSIGNIYNVGFHVDISELTNKWFIIDEYVLLSLTRVDGVEVQNQRASVIKCTFDDVQKHLDDPYSEHKLHYEEARPLRLLADSIVHLITDGTYYITYYSGIYLKRPQLVSLEGEIDCDLPEHTHDEIVGLATSMVLENIEQPRYQTQLNELNKIE
jgi:hypothetical protein